jgi:hypothetical protein
VERELLESFIADGLTIREIGSALDAHPRTVQAWLREHGLQTARRQGASAGSGRTQRHCSRHGLTGFARRSEGGWRCLKCRSEAVTRRRKRVKEVLVTDAGGACVLCGYSRCLGALEFHHVDPTLKRFSVGARGVTRALAAARDEATKCALLCANCHAEVEAGLATLPPDPSLG